MRVGMVGLGRMGNPMARHIAAAGHAVTAVDVDPDARQRAENAGLSASASHADLAGCEAVCSSLPDVPQVLDSYLGADGILAHLDPGAVCFDLSTVSVEASRRVADEARQRGIAFLDTPVSGSSIHAEKGVLVVLAGGDAEALATHRQVLECFSSAIHHVGDNGDGLRMKLITNRLVATHLLSIAEAIVELEQTGLDVPTGIELLRASVVPRLLDYKAEPLADRDFTPAFTVDLMRKDLRLAEGEHPAGRLATVTEAVFDLASEAGHGDDDMAAIISVIERDLA